MGRPQGGTALECSPGGEPRRVSAANRRAAGATERSDVRVRYENATVRGPESDRRAEHRSRREAGPAAAYGLGVLRRIEIGATGVLDPAFAACSVLSREVR